MFRNEGSWEHYFGQNIECMEDLADHAKCLSVFHLVQWALDVFTNDPRYQIVVKKALN